MLPEHKPVRRGREMIDLLAVEEPKPKPAKIRAVSYEAAIDQLFKRMRSSRSALTQQALSTPRGPVPNERRRRRPPHGRRTGTTGEWPPAARGSPPAPAKDGPGRGPPPRGRVRSRCTSRGARTRPGTRRRRRNEGREGACRNRYWLGGRWRLPSRGEGREWFQSWRSPLVLHACRRPRIAIIASLMKASKSALTSLSVSMQRNLAPDREKGLRDPKRTP